MKKVFAMLCLVLMSSVALAESFNPTLELPRFGMGQRYVDWTLNRTGKDAISFTASQTYTVLVYVYRYLNNSARTSDPVQIVCNGVPSIINPGTGMFCKVPAGASTKWKVEPGYLMNGANGVIFLAE